MLGKVVLTYGEPFCHCDKNTTELQKRAMDVGIWRGEPALPGKFRVEDM